MLQKTNIAISRIQHIIKNIDEILLNIKTESVLLDKVIDQISGGKRLRPILVVASARSLGFDEEKILHDTACIVEYIHIASLLHDDVIDEAKKRRGKESVNYAYGNRVAIMSGDYLYSLAYNKVLDVDINIAKEISKAAYNLALGEISEIENFSKIIKEEEYFDIIYKKTASLIESSCTSGCLLAKNPTQLDYFREYGKNLGLAFQIKDDLMDYSNKDIGKDTYNDIQEGKVTLPLILAFQKDSQLQYHLNEYFKTKKEEHKQYCIASCKAYGVDRAFEVAKQKALTAKQSIQHLPGSIYKDILLFLADYAVSREK
ncbi:MAG: polyprenyl synthetase family protein [Desulfurella sp.]|uniref:polyprenyl synthetase family protein n=1 Tax=Desulfurella sp. TaxID=1962857 RepID=UPI003C9823CE